MHQWKSGIDQDGMPQERLACTSLQYIFTLWHARMFAHSGIVYYTKMRQAMLSKFQSISLHLRSICVIKFWCVNLCMHAKNWMQPRTALHSSTCMHNACHFPFFLKVVWKVGTNTRMVTPGPAPMVATAGKCILIQCTM